MTIDEVIILYEGMAEENQKVVDTHIISFTDCDGIDTGVTLDELYCDDAEIIEEKLAVYKKYANDYRQIAEWLKELKMLKEQNKWVSVKDRLPELGHDVLGIDPYNDVLQACTYDDCGEIKWVSDRGSNTLIVAWRPLPKSYEAEQEETE